ncbi:3-hydroxyisobutyrate dehydrogenase [Reyranella sp.]|uniref:3-hydroxyisobutyrate dehydrogenase n=1 Tax=Reyranella sp. TaxID=1929291 RepID=UPI0027228A48|nr:3-hydroxyisobutyrate dehydrogenase [Reyranella sp.]MDO8974135.1 3-hydroxyisobutyrate dehydrogenase [Reyranella sp.]MDP3241655.1 3-hydroxyisobutyrate dehydrogenase [Reyranella sp.]
MAKIAFIGLGNMGGPMAANLAKAQHHVMAFDLSDAAVSAAVEKGAHKAASAAEAVKGAEIVVTMLPAGKHVREVYEKDVLPNVAKGTLLIDCSTIDVESARHVAALAEKAGMDMVDAPVSGGVGGATAGTLTFMVGGSEASFAKARPILEKMGKNIVLAGTSGGGQAAKICNNMILGVSMIAVSEAFMLAKRLGLDAQKLFDVASTASGQCWSLTNYCPVPGPVPTSPANRDYQPGFTAAMMLKDLMLAQQAASAAGASTPLGAEAAQLFSLFVNSGNGAKDFSGIIKMLDGK